MFRLLAALLAVTLALAALLAPAAAQILPTTAPAAATTPATPITDSTSADEDARLTARIRGIFAQVPALRPVTVDVHSGVVTLKGVVADQNAIDQAAEIAGRVAGVVTVQNQVTRDLAVERNLHPALSGVTGRATQVWRALPLLGVAIIVAVLIGGLGYLIARQRKLIVRLAPNPFLADLLATAIRFVFVTAGIVLALDIVGATALLGAVLGGAGVIGIALGFAVRDSIDNYVSSLMLSVRQPFRANDSVRIDSWEGQVVRLTSRATILITGDGNHLRIPNSTVFKAVILNFTTNPRRQFAFDYPIAHDADPCAARNAAVEALRRLPYVLGDPAPAADLVDMAGPAQLLRMTGWVDQTRADFGKSRTRAMEAVRHALREADAPAVPPAYRVRIEREPRPGTGPAPAEEAPFEQVAPATGSDVAPKHHIDRMVRVERAGGDGNDLLDANRPVE